MTRRDSLLALGTLATTMPFTLHAQEYKGALIIETDHEESRFKRSRKARSQGSSLAGVAAPF